MIQRFTISRDDAIYEAFPDLTMTPSGKLMCVFAECTHHGNRPYTCIMICESSDRGRTWSAKRRLSEPTNVVEWWNCPRISTLRDGRLAALVDKIPGNVGHQKTSRWETLQNFLYLSEDDGATWSEPILTSAQGIVPDKLLELETGRWILACQVRDPETVNWFQRLWYSDNQGKTWSDPVIVGKQKGMNLCEVSILPIERSTLVAFHREDSGDGQDCYKTISHDNGQTWGEPIRFPLPGCHRPVAGFLKSGHIMITHRFMQGGKGWAGYWTQNFFAAITDKTSALATSRKDAWTRILPIDFDRSPQSDLGYSGWVQFDDGEIYIVNYIMDDSPKGQIRGYALDMEDFLLETTST